MSKSVDRCIYRSKHVADPTIIFAISVKRNAIYFLKIILSMHLTIQHNDRVLQVTKNLMNHKSLK